MINCTFLLIMFSLVFLVLFICLSRRHLVGYLISFFSSLTLTVITYFLFIFNSDLNNTYTFFNKVLIKLRINLDELTLKSFINCGLLLIIFFVCLVIIEIIIIKIMNKKDNNSIINKKYHITKTILVIFSYLSITCFLLVLITNLNIAYELNGGFLNLLFELIKKGILLL